MISKIVLKSDVWPGSEKCGFNPKFEDNGLKSGCYRISKLPPLSVKYVCPISQETNHPIMIPKIVLKSVLWRGSESALNCCIFQLLCFSLHPTLHTYMIYNISGTQSPLPPKIRLRYPWFRRVMPCTHIDSSYFYDEDCWKVFSQRQDGACCKDSFAPGWTKIKTISLRRRSCTEKRSKTI